MVDVHDQRRRERADARAQQVHFVEAAADRLADPRRFHALGYDFLVPAACATLNATTIKPPKIIESSEGRRARRAARLAKARRRKPPVPTKERVPKWVHVVEE